MKRVVFGIFIILGGLVLTGCGNENKVDSNEVALCKKITPQIEKYERSEINYNELLNQIEPDYNNYCKDSDSNICSSIKAMYWRNNTSTEMQDCSQYNTSTDLGKAAKDLCESTNKAIQESVARQGSVEKASVNLLKSDCKDAK